MADWHAVEWIDGEREPQVAPDPKYPRGKDIDATEGEFIQSCRVRLPYPARRCGVYTVRCLRCHYSCAVTTAGRADDPRTIRIGCKLGEAGPRGTFSEGRLSDSDEGDLSIAVSDMDDEGNIHISFGTAVSWLALPRRQVMDLCFGLLKKCGVPVEIETRDNTEDV